MMQRHKIMSRLLPAAATGALVCLMPFASLALAQGNPWAPKNSGQLQPAPAEPIEKPKYYQEPTVAIPQPLANPNAPSRFAPDDLDQRLATGRPLDNGIPGTGVPGMAVPATPLATPLQTPAAPIAGPVPGYMPGTVPVPGYGAGVYPQGYGYGYPAFGATPYAGPGYPGNYGGYLPPPGGRTGSYFPGFDFAPFGFW